MNKIVAVDCYLSHNLGDDLFLFTLLKRYPNVMFNVNADCSYGYLTHDFNNANLVISGSNSDSGSLLLKMKRYCSNNVATSDDQVARKKSPNARYQVA